MKQLIIHYNDGSKKEDLYFQIKSQQELLVILFRELSPEKLWERGWNDKHCWSEVI